MSVNYEQLAQDALLQINATTAHAQLDGIAQQAAAIHWSYTHFLGRLLEPETPPGANAWLRPACTSRACPGPSA